MRKTLQIIVQILFLGLFIALIVLGKAQMWMAVFLVGGIAVSFLFSRIYCGWFCPINTGIKTVSWIKKKLHIGSFKIPAWVKKPWIRYAILALFIALVVFTMITGRKLPVLLSIFAIGVFISLFFDEELFHCYICPYGTLLSFPASTARKSLKIDQESCVSCGTCKKVCTVNAVMQEGKTFTIDKKECLACMICVYECKKDAIHFEK